MKLELCHAETCLPDYWRGHHRAHLQIPVWHGMTMREIKNALKCEIIEGAIMGSDDLTYLLAADWVPPEKEKAAQATIRAAYAAINRLSPAKKGQRKFFVDLEETAEDDDDGCTIYAYFVFVEL